MRQVPVVRWMETEHGPLLPSEGMPPQGDGAADGPMQVPAQSAAEPMQQAAEGTIAHAIREQELSGGWRVPPTPAECESRLQAAQFRLLLAFLQSERLIAGCSLVLEGGVVPATIAACLRALPTVGSEAELRTALADESQGAVVVGAGARIELTGDHLTIRWAVRLVGEAGGALPVIAGAQGKRLPAQASRCGWRTCGSRGAAITQSTATEGPRWPRTAASLPVVRHTLTAQARPARCGSA